MKKNEPKQAGHQPGDLKDKSDQLSPNELTDDELDQVSGGNVNLTDFKFTKKIDKASPTL